MTLFSFVILSVLFFFFFRKSRRSAAEIYIFLTALGIALEIMMSIGYFLSIGGLDFGYSEFVILLDTAVSVWLIFKRGVKNKSLKLGLLLITSCMLSLFIQVIHPIQGGIVPSAADWDHYYFLGQAPQDLVIGVQQIKEIIHLTCYVLIMLAAVTLNANEMSHLIKITFDYEKLFIWFGFVELVLIKIMHAQAFLTSIEIMIFGDKYIGDGPMLSVGFSDRLRGLKSEPSMYGFALFLFLVHAYILYRNTKNKKFKHYAIAAFILMALSMSFSAIVCIAGVVVYWLAIKYKNGSRKARNTIILSAIILAILGIAFLRYVYTHEFSSYYLKRIHMALINMEDLSIDGWGGDYATYDGSTKIRMISIIGVMKYFGKYPLFGIALGSTYAHSTMATVLSCTGLVGTWIWLKFTFLQEHGRKNRIYYFALLIWVLLLFILGSGLFPYYGIENILITYTFGIFSKQRKVVENESKNFNCNGLL